MNITKKKQTHRYRKQTCGYQWGEGSREGQERGRGLRGTNYYTMYKINKLQGHTVQHREYSQYFIVTINGLKPLKIVNPYVVHLKLI